MTLIPNCNQQSFPIYISWQQNIGNMQKTSPSAFKRMGALSPPQSTAPFPRNYHGSISSSMKTKVITILGFIPHPLDQKTGRLPPHTFLKRW